MEVWAWRLCFFFGDLLVGRVHWVLIDSHFHERVNQLDNVLMTQSLHNLYLQSESMCHSLLSSYLFHIVFGVFILEYELFHGDALHCVYISILLASALPHHSERSLADYLLNFEFLVQSSFLPLLVKDALDRETVVHWEMLGFFRALGPLGIVIAFLEKSRHF